jgi:hypothetical protein
MTDKQTPFRRNWLKEAYMIFKGDTKIKVKKEHVIETMAQLVVIKQEAEQLRILIERSYNQHVERCKKEGLPIPPKPFSLMPKTLEPLDV